MYRHFVTAGAIGSLVLFYCVSASAAVGTNSNWATFIGPKPTSGVSTSGTRIGIAPFMSDGYDGQPVWAGTSSLPDIFLLAYRTADPAAWAGPTGFYSEDGEHTPIPAGGSKTWSDFYLWSSNWSPGPDNQVVVRNLFLPLVAPPAGYRGHLVIDRVAAGVDWTGRPMDYWLDMTQNAEMYLPIAQVSDPTDPTAPLWEGTRFHLTVYTPEPSSLAALGVGLLPLGLAAVRRRRMS